MFGSCKFSTALVLTKIDVARFGRNKAIQYSLIFFQLCQSPLVPRPASWQAGAPGQTRGMHASTTLISPADPCGRLLLTQPRRHRELLAKVCCLRLQEELKAQDCKLTACQLLFLRFAAMRFAAMRSARARQARARRQLARAPGTFAASRPKPAGTSRRTYLPLTTLPVQRPRTRHARQ